MSTATEEILGPHGLLSRSLDGFEVRPSQLEMARLVEEAIREEVHAVVEAGTGTGKTFGYLVPAIVSGKKTVVSTGTKNLQEQIFYKDIPLLRKAGLETIDAVIMKGRKNYLCLHRYHHLMSLPRLFEGDRAEAKGRLARWVDATRYADRAELPWLADDETLWDGLSCTSEQCLGQECLYVEDCFLNRLRARAARARVIIVNHHLFCADLKVKRHGFGEIIPRFQVAVFDEAHSLEEVATSYFGDTVSTAQVLTVVSEAETAAQGLAGEEKTRLISKLMAVKTSVERLAELFDSREPKGRIEDACLTTMSEGPGRVIGDGLRYVRTRAETWQSGKVNPQALGHRARECEDLLDEILGTRHPQWLKWYEKRPRSVVLHSSPLDISSPFKEFLYRKVETVVFTSATLSTHGTFDYVRSRLGIEDGLEGMCPSHFDFASQSLLYLPKDMPVPNSPHFASRVARRVLDILERTDGRALVLFTSYLNMNLVYEMVRGKIPYTVFKQGDAPRSALLDRFRENVHSVLLATGSFWQGVDVPGESLSCLIIDKLPFGSPGEPLVAARIEAIRDRGGNPFMDYQVPTAVISLKQGLGRLIRKRTDRGILAVLDPRIITSRYGGVFLKSLPPIPITHDLDDITGFFEREGRRSD